MRILVSGAGDAGPVLAYWLTRHGFSATVVERAPTVRRTRGHAVDLFRPATRTARLHNSMTVDDYRLSRSAV